MAKNKSTPVKKNVVKKKSYSKKTTSNRIDEAVLFNKEHYTIFGIGLAVIFLGLILMIGGGHDNPNEWNPDQIYSFRITVLAPILILVGLGIEIYGIMKPIAPKEEAASIAE